MLKPITTNEYTIKDSFSFTKEVEEFDPNLIMVSFDIKSLFTNIPVTETIGLCVENLYRNQAHIDSLSKSSFRRLLEMTMYESFFIFDQKYYKQCDGVAMGSPLGPTLANLFMFHFEKIWLEHCPTQFKPVVYRRYVDDTFLLFRSTEHAEKFKRYLKQHKNIAFTSEIEQNSSLSFLDVKISRENNRFVSSVYRKPTFNGVFTNFESFISKCYKPGLIDTLLYRGFSLCSDMEKIHQEISSLKSVFKSNGYPKNFIDSYIKHFLDKLFAKNEVSLTVPKLQLLCVLPYTGKSSLDFRARLRRTIEENIPFCKYNVVFRSICILGNFFRLKDSLERKKSSLE